MDFGVVRSKVYTEHGRREYDRIFNQGSTEKERERRGRLSEDAGGEGTAGDE